MPASKLKQKSSEAGLTLIELIISITIMSISMTSIMSVFSNSAANSSTPMVREQALSIASAYMEEIMLQPYVDPTSSTNTCEEGASNRALFDDVDDYDCVNDSNGAIDQNGHTITGLEAYNINIDITADTLNSATAKRIDVTVTRDGLAGDNIK
jgi:MSHA pilin protein MshD